MSSKLQFGMPALYFSILKFTSKCDFGTCFKVRVLFNCCYISILKWPVTLYFEMCFKLWFCNVLCNSILNCPLNYEFENCFKFRFENYLKRRFLKCTINFNFEMHFEYRFSNFLYTYFFKKCPLLLYFENYFKLWFKQVIYNAALNVRWISILEITLNYDLEVTLHSDC